MHTHTHTHCTLVTKVYYPSTPGMYIPIFFIPGLNGVVFPEFYSTVLANFAAFGYIVAGIDPFYPAVDSIQPEITEKTLPEKAFEELRWVRSAR